MTDDVTPAPVVNAQIVAQRVGSEDVVTALTDAAGAYTLQVPAEIATWRISAEVTEATTPAECLGAGRRPRWSCSAACQPQVQTGRFHLHAVVFIRCGVRC